MQQIHDHDDPSPKHEFHRIAGRVYALLEATGEAWTKYRDKLIKATRPTTDGKVAMAEGIAATEPYLVSLCLYYAEADGEGWRIPLIRMGDQMMADPTKQVHVTVIGRWAARVQKDLFKRIRVMSDLAEDEEHPLVKALKADPEAPVTVEALAAWAEKLDEKEHFGVRAMFVGAEGSAKN